MSKVFTRDLKKARFRVSINSTTSSIHHHSIMLRTPLGPISSNRRRGPELTPYKRGIINGAHKNGCTPKYIAGAENTSLNTVKKTILHASQHPNGVSKPRSGRPPTTTVRDRRIVIRIAWVNPRITYQKLQEESQLDISRSTFYRILREYGLKNWLAKQRPLLTPEVAAIRLAWCLERRSWKWEEWSKVIWSDECSVERGSGKERAWVFRFPHEKWTKKMIQPKKKGKGVSVMVWGAFYGVGEQSNLLWLGRDPDAKRNGYTARSYIGCLEDQLPSMWEPGLLFMQDNAPIHTSRLARAWLEENGIDVMEWPPYSPDLNPNRTPLVSAQKKLFMTYGQTLKKLVEV